MTATNNDVIVYEQCAFCDHFIEELDPQPGCATHMHLDDGEQEYDHDATPSGVVLTLDEWRQQSPHLFEKHDADDKIGPNSMFHSRRGKDDTHDHCDIGGDHG